VGLERGPLSLTASVVYWSDFLATNIEVPGSKPGHTRFSNSSCSGTGSTKPDRLSVLVVTVSGAVVEVQGSISGAPDFLNSGGSGTDSTQIDRLCGLVGRFSGYRFRSSGFSSRCYQII